MSIITNAVVFECDGPSCPSQIIEEHHRLGVEISLPTGWFRLNDDNPATAGWGFCSITCIYQWADAEVAS